MVVKSKTGIKELGSGKGIYVPAALLKDSTFPFTEKESDDLIIEIRGKELVVRLRGKNEEL